MNLPGEHIFINGNDNTMLTEAFNIDGLPHYAIMDKAGAIIESEAGRPGSAKTKEVLKKLLEY
ncbi:MAG TPA: hypothetical protein VHO72_00920 [Bacteroidales bacterium]|nr:hypothetical protein [Bacteroidales bacterium]